MRETGTMAPAGELVLDRRTPHWLSARAAVAGHATVSVRRWEPSKRYGMNVAVVAPASPGSDEVIVYPMSYDYRIDRLALERLRVMALVLGRRVVGVETPGITMDFESPADTRAVGIPFLAGARTLGGDYGGLAELQLHAIDAALGEPARHLRLVGESLGAQFVAAIARRREAASVDLVEPVNCLPMSPLALYRVGRRLSGGEAELRARYVRANADGGWGRIDPFEMSSPESAAVDRRLKRLSNQGRLVLLTAVGLVWGLEHELRRRASTTPIHVWRAVDSTVCASSTVDRLVDDLTRAGVDARQTTLRCEHLPAGHHVLTRLDALVGFAAELRRSWTVR